MTGYEQDCLREVAKWLNEKPSTPAPTEAIATLCAVVQVSEAYIATVGRDVERLRKVADAARCIRHWHDASNDGMIVSGEHVRALWQALSDLDAAPNVELTCRQRREGEAK